MALEISDNTTSNDYISFNTEWSTGYLADVFTSLFNDKFTYTNGTLYHFNGVYWKTDDKNNAIIHNFVDKEYHNYLLDELYKFDNTTTEKTPQHVTTVIKKRMEIGKLRNISHRESFIKDLIIKITNNDIVFDQKPYLFAFENKIYDLNKGQFIEPEAEQYISVTTGYKYDESYDTPTKALELDKLLNTIFPQPEIKKLYLTILSTGLDGLPLEKFVIANGGGGNGKGLLNEFVQHTLGKYAYILPVNVLLGPLKTGSNPEIANMNAKRFIIAREPDRNLMFNCGTIKEILGGNELNARVNYSNDTKVNLQLTLILECNDKPKLNEVNDALGRRIIDVPFKNRFVDKYVYDELDDEDKKTTFITNSYYKTLEFKNEYKQALFFILAEHYKEFHKNKRELPLPKEIEKRNIDYLAHSDELLNWFNDKYEKTDNQKDVIKLKLIYEAFKSSEYFENLSKADKRQNNYKNFIEKLEKNMFLKKLVKQDRCQVYIITSYKMIEDEEENKSYLDM